MQYARTAWRLVRTGEHILSGALVASILVLLDRAGWQVSAIPRIVQWWHRRLCRILHLRVEVSGVPVPGAKLLVANHISWLDIPVLGALEPTMFLSKSEVRDWPLLGWMSEAAGTLFIERGGNQSAHITEIMRERLGGGCSVLFFPEGTTTDGREVRRFHPRLFAPAQDAGALLQPVALAYRPHPGRDDVAPFIGDDAFMPHLIRVLAEPGLGVQVRFLDPLEAAGRPRRRLAEYTREAIRGALGCGPGDAKAAEERGRRKERRTVQG